MIPEEALGIVLARLEQCGIPYMITGSFASNLHGVPRTTQDADVVIETNAISLERFVKGLDKDFYVSLEAAQEALANKRIFNVIHYKTGFKVDLIIRKSRSFSQQEFSRRQSVAFLKHQRWFTSAEDTILSKLEWSQMGGSERQFNDALNIAKIQGKGLDSEYLSKWAEELGISELLARLFKELHESE